MGIDFSKKVIRSTDESGHKGTSAIKSMERTEKQIILQGIENHRGWSIAIDRETGALKAASSGKDVNFMFFGACTVI